MEYNITYEYIEKGSMQIMDKKDERDPLILTIGQRIQKYRMKQNLTQDQVAETAGISQKHLSRIEQGYHNPRFDMIIQIAEALNIPTDALAKDMSDNDISIFLENIRPNVEKLSASQLEYLQKSIKLLADIKF